jgi:hypothetical protein
LNSVDSHRSVAEKQELGSGRLIYILRDYRLICFSFN